MYVPISSASIRAFRAFSRRQVPPASVLGGPTRWVPAASRNALPEGTSAPRRSAPPVENLWPPSTSGAEHAELIALRVGEHNPGLVALADVDARGTERE